MGGSIGAGMLRGWIMLWDTEMTWLAFVTAAAVVGGLAVESVAALRRRHR